MDRLYVCQYVVFIIRLILSYLPVHQLISLPSSPLTSVAVVELLGEGERQLGMPRGGCQTYVTGNVHFILSVEGKNVVHECKGELEYGLADGEVSMTILVL